MKKIIRNLSKEQKEVLYRILTHRFPEAAEDEINGLNWTFERLENSSLKEEKSAEKVKRHLKEKSGIVINVKNLIKEINRFQQPKSPEISELFPILTENRRNICLKIPKEIYLKIFDYVIERSGNSQEDVAILIQQMKIFWNCSQPQVRDPIANHQLILPSRKGNFLRSIDIPKVVHWISSKSIPLHCLIQNGFTKKDIEGLLPSLEFVDLAGITQATCALLSQSEKVKDLIIEGNQTYSLFAIPHKESLTGLGIIGGSLSKTFFKALEAFSNLNELFICGCALKQENQSAIQRLPTSIKVTMEDCINLPF